MVSPASVRPSWLTSVGVPADLAMVRAGCGIVVGVLTVDGSELTRLPSAALVPEAMAWLTTWPFDTSAALTVYGPVAVQVVSAPPASIVAPHVTATP